ncbi:MAG TPA: serine/threonine-protein kinase [Chloroflexi bacterium]|nr:serine/threonine-protein kinase [Chloroflexota bacterium]
MSPSDSRKGLLDRLKSAQLPRQSVDREVGEEREPLPGRSGDAVAPSVIPEARATPDRGSRDDEFLRPGDILQERYEIKRYLSKGGMGAVYLARDLRFANVEKLVAVKEMISAIRDSVTSRIGLETFQREANILASLSHPAIPKVFDYFHQERRVYLVIEYIHGTDLESLLAEIDYPLPPENVVDWAIQTCDVLTYLHNHKPNPIVFRDMKPSNIMVREDDQRVVLIDFGIAKVFQSGKRGTMIGTEGYSPPEQYRGIADPRGDIYALGATLHHLLTGRDPRKEPPFTFQEHPIRQFNPSATPELEAIVARAVAYDVEERYPSATEMREDLLRLTGVPKIGPASRPSPGEPTPVWSFVSRGEIRCTPAVFENALYFGSYDHNLYCLETSTGEERWKYTTDAGVVSSPCFWNDTVFFGSEDRILYAVYTRTGRIVWTCPTDGKIRSTPVEEYDHIFFGSDDHHLYAVSAKSGQELWRFDAGAPIRSSPTVGGELLVFGADDGHVYALDVQSGEVRWKYLTGRAVQSTPSMAHDMAYVGSADSSLYALDLANGWPVWRFRTRGRVISSPLVDENTIYFGSNDHHVYALDARSGSVLWKYSTTGPVVSSPRVSQGILYVGSADGYLYSLDARTGNMAWRFPTEGPITGAPAIGTGLVFVGSTDHAVYALPAAQVD